MVIRRRYLAGGVVLLAAAVLPLFFLWRSDAPERQVRKTLTTLAADISRSENEKLTTGLLKNNSLAALFAEKSKLEFRHEGYNGNYTPDEIAANAARLRMIFSWMLVTLSDIEVKFPAADTADVTLTGTMSGRTKRGAKVDEVRYLECRLSRHGEKWLISSVMVRELLER